MQDTKEIELTSCELQELEKFGQKISSFGANFLVFNAEGILIRIWEGGIYKSHLEGLIECVLKAPKQENEQNVYFQDRSESNKNIISVVLKSDCESSIIAVIDSSGKEFDDQNISCKKQRTVSFTSIFSELLELFAFSFISKSKTNQQIELVSTELAQVYEELVLLHKLSTNMHLTEADGNFLQMACDSLTDIVNVEGIAILLEKTIDGQNRLNLAAGSGLIDIDEHAAAVLHDRLLEEIECGKDGLLDSDIDSPLKYNWPANIRNIIAVPLFSNNKQNNTNKRSLNVSKILGILVAINRLDKPDFDSTDINLFTSVANGCAVFVENGRLFKDLKDLFVGSLRALTNSIDAKDQYTRGHSERVAFISKWIADELVRKGLLDKNEVPKVYLAGLLHDIGKMGIEEAVLRKKGGLTDQEMYCIKTHPSVGASILSEIKQMRDIVPGVLCHHEKENGKGYPNGIKGDQIPLVSKIIAVADSFDAMTSKRTYRNALSVKQAVSEIEKGLGVQYDEMVGKTFLQSDVYKLWDIIQKGFTDMYENDALSEYGSLAVGTLIR